MAVTRDGIPVRVWCWPGNTTDSPLIRQVRDEMRDWTLGKVIWVADRGFTSAANRRHLAAGGGHYIIGREAALRLRRGHRGDGPTGPLPGRHARTCGSRKSRSPRTSGSWSATTPTPPTATPRSARDLVERARHHDHRHRPADRRRSGPSCAGVISTKPGLNRFLRVTPGGLLRVDAAKITADAKLDGKYLLRCSRPAPVGRGHRAGLQAVVGGRTRLAGHEDRSWTCGRSITASRTASAPTSCSAGSRCCWSGSSRPPPATPGTDLPRATSNACTSAPSPAPPAPSANAPNSPPTNATSSAKLDIDPPKKIIELGPPPATP